MYQTQNYLQTCQTTKLFFSNFYSVIGLLFLIIVTQQKNILFFSVTHVTNSMFLKWSKIKEILNKTWGFVYTFSYAVNSDILHWLIIKTHLEFVQKIKKKNAKIYSAK